MINQKKCVPCQGGIPALNENQINELIPKIDSQWKVIDNIELRKEYVFESYLDAIKFVNLVAELSEDEGHHPYIHINYKKVIVILFTHKINGLHENDFILASKCDLLILKK